jgi:hypothetical protein
MVLEVDGIVAVLLVKRAWLTGYTTTTIHFHSLWLNVNA